MVLEQKQELLVLLGLFKTVYPSASLRKGKSQPTQMSNAYNQLEFDSTKVDYGICHLNTGSLSGSCHL